MLQMPFLLHESCPTWGANSPFKCKWMSFCRFPGSYLAVSFIIKPNSGQSSHFGAWIFKDPTYIRDSREFMESKLSHYKSSRLSRTEPVPSDAKISTCAFFSLDNNIFPFIDVWKDCSRLNPFVPIGPLVCIRARTPLAVTSWGVAVVHPCRLSI